MSMGSMTSCESLLDADLGPSPTGSHRQSSGAGAGAGAIGPPERVAIVGSGNWGSAIARIVGRNVVEQVRERGDVYAREEGEGLVEVTLGRSKLWEG